MPLPNDTHSVPSDCAGRMVSWLDCVSRAR